MGEPMGTTGEGTDVTRPLQECRLGNREALDQLKPLIYEELGDKHHKGSSLPIRSAQPVTGAEASKEESLLSPDFSLRVDHSDFLDHLAPCIWQDGPAGSEISYQRPAYICPRLIGRHLEKRLPHGCHL